MEDDAEGITLVDGDVDSKQSKDLRSTVARGPPEGRQGSHPKGHQGSDSKGRQGIHPKVAGAATRRVTRVAASELTMT